MLLVDESGHDNIDVNFATAGPHRRQTGRAETDPEGVADHAPLLIGMDRFVLRSVLV